MGWWLNKWTFPLLALGGAAVLLLVAEAVNEGQLQTRDGQQVTGGGAHVLAIFLVIVAGVVVVGALVAFAAALRGALQERKRMR